MTSKSKSTIVAKLEKPNPMSYEEAKKLIKEKFGAELTREAYDLILEIKLEGTKDE